jgi:glucose/arabinose dehydrogenase
MRLELSAVARRVVALCAIVGAGLALHPVDARAQEPLVDPSLTLSTIAGGLSQPIAIAFIGPDDILVIEKATGQVKRVTDGVVTGVVLDLAVNANSDRGLRRGTKRQPRPPVPVPSERRAQPVQVRRRASQGQGGGQPLP